MIYQRHIPDEELVSAQLETLMQDPGSLNLVFDAPYYKVRYGNYLSKTEADVKRAEFQKIGFPDAWVVRDKVTTKVKVRKK